MMSLLPKVHQSSQKEILQELDMLSFFTHAQASQKVDANWESQMQRTVSFLFTTGIVNLLELCI
jgi:hypothetical protein